jgi:hypothetical protein
MIERALTAKKQEIRMNFCDEFIRKGNWEVNSLTAVDEDIVIRVRISALWWIAVSVLKHITVRSELQECSRMSFESFDTNFDEP